MNWFKKLLASKISITIVQTKHTSIEHFTSPKVIEETIVKQKKLSDFRFVADNEIDHDGEETIWYFTQQYINGNWTTISDTVSRNKSKAMGLHLKLIESGSLESKKTRTVLWEGLSKEETKTWIEIQK